MTIAAQTVAIIGGGVIGGGWAARFLLMGWNVQVFDPDPEVRRKIGGVIDNAIRYGFGLRWAQMGLFETYRVAGGEVRAGECISVETQVLKGEGKKLHLFHWMRAGDRRANVDPCEPGDTTGQ